MNNQTPLTIEFLGTGGAIRTPRPNCHCELCRGARELGVPWSRMGPSVFVHGPDVLIDTSEDIYFQLERAKIADIAAGFYSHWHPDHTAGRRVYETRNADFTNWPPSSRCTPIYLPKKVAEDFEIWMGLAENFRYLEKRGWVEMHSFDDPIELNGWRITAHALAESYVFCFLFEELAGTRRVLIAMDELVGWTPPVEFSGVDIAILPAGIFEFHPLTGQRLTPTKHPILETEATFRQTLAMAEALQPRKLIFTHIEEPFGITPPQFEEVAANLQHEYGWDVTFAYDTYQVALEPI